MVQEHPIMMEEQVQESMASWLIHSAGFLGLLILLTSLIVFLAALIVVFASRRPAMIAACFPWLLLPLWLGCLGAFWGSLQSFMVIAQSEVAPKPSELAEGVSVALVSPLLALVLTFPGYLILTVGLFLRTVAAGKQTTTGA